MAEPGMTSLIALLWHLSQGAGVFRVLVVTGLSGEPQYAASFARQATALVTMAKSQWRAADSGIIYLAENPATAPGATGRATRDAVLAAVATLGAASGPDDVLLIYLAGHGSEQGDQPRFNLPGPDLSAGDLAMALGPVTRPMVVVINAASASGGFLKPLAGARRVVITATKTGFEKNATTFGEHFVRGLTSGEADADKNGRVTVAEAFQFAKAEVARGYQSTNRLMTEHAQIEDAGIGTLVNFPLVRDQAADDPKLAPLVAERTRLETAVAALRGRKATMDSTAYQRDLEQLLLKLAEVSQSIRAAQGKRP